MFLHLGRQGLVDGVTCLVLEIRGWQRRMDIQAATKYLSSVTLERMIDRLCHFTVFIILIFIFHDFMSYLCKTLYLFQVTLLRHWFLICFAIIWDSLHSICRKKDKQKGGRRRKLKRVLFIKAKRALAFIPWLAKGSNSVFVSVKKRIAFSDATDDDHKLKGRLYKFIKGFLVISVIALIIEFFAFFNDWDLSSVHPWEVHQNIVQWFYLSWLSFRVEYIAPLIQSLSNFCILLFLIQSLDRLVLCVGWFWIKYKKLKPHVLEPLDLEDASTYPMVLVQIPMCNEKEETSRLLTSINARLQNQTFLAQLRAQRKRFDDGITRFTMQQIHFNTTEEGNNSASVQTAPQDNKEANTAKEATLSATEQKANNNKHTTMKCAVRTQEHTIPATPSTPSSPLKKMRPDDS